MRTLQKSSVEEQGARVEAKLEGMASVVERCVEEELRGFAQVRDIPHAAAWTQSAVRTGMSLSIAGALPFASPFGRPSGGLMW